MAAAAAAAVAAALPAGASLAAGTTKKPVFEKTDSGLRYTDVKKGTGPFPGVCCMCVGGMRGGGVGGCGIPTWLLWVGAPTGVSKPGSGWRQRGSLTSLWSWASGMTGQSRAV